MRMRTRAMWMAALLIGATHGGELAGQELADRVRAADGRVTFRVALEEGVEVCDNGVIHGDHRRWNWRDGGEAGCSAGIAEVVVEARDGRVDALDLEPWEGPGSSPAGTDLGEVDGSEAARFLTGLAVERDGLRSARKPAEHAMMAATLLEGVEVWPDLLAVARDRDLSSELRRSALFWLGQAAEEPATAGIAEVAGDASESDQDVRDAAVFALSQRPSGEAVPVLMELVRTAPHAKTRRSALFWLSQMDDPRVVDFFEEILIGGA